MKKFFSILTVCAVFALGACNHASENKDNAADSTKMKAAAPMAKPDTSKKAMPMDTTKKDTTKKM